MFFSVMTKNFNWEISTKNLVTFKIWDGVNDEKFLYDERSLKNTIIKRGTRGRGVMEKHNFKGGRWIA